MKPSNMQHSQRSAFAVVRIHYPIRQRFHRDYAGHELSVRRRRCVGPFDVDQFFLKIRSRYSSKKP
jgi:hypothetical protein